MATLHLTSSTLSVPGLADTPADVVTADQRVVKMKYALAMSHNTALTEALQATWKAAGRCGVAEMPSLWGVCGHVYCRSNCG